MKKELKKKITTRSGVKEKEEEPSPYQVMNWTPHPGGRPTKYDPKFCDKVIEYFDVPPFKEVSTVFGVKRIPNILPTIAGFAHWIGVSKDTIYEWKKNYPEFSDAVQRAGANQEHMLLTNALLGIYNHKFAALVGINVTDMKVQQADVPQNVATIETFKLPQRYEPPIGQSVIDGIIVANKGVEAERGETNDSSSD